MRTWIWLALWLGACTGTDPKDDDTGIDDDDPALLDDDRDGVNNAQDCQDDNPNVFPGARELCDGIDNDCDDLIDDADDGLDRSTATEYYVDDDDDGWGAESKGFFCREPRRASLLTGDCDDADPENYPENTEKCDGKDNDCDNVLDDADDNLDLASGTTWFYDLDGDTYGDPGNQVRVCTRPPQTVTNGGDCDDANNQVWTAKQEQCNGFDDNCDGLLDEADPTIDLSTLIDMWADADDDGYGDPTTPISVCTPVLGYVINDEDCDDLNPNDNPAAAEICDGRDNNCDARVDDADPALDPLSTPTWYRDRDADTYGDPAQPRVACAQPAGFVANPGDCNDAEALAWTGNPEVCDGVDNDCANGADEADPTLDPALLTRFYADLDDDDHGDPDAPVDACFLPADAAITPDDCDDQQPRAWDGRPETCDGVDNDCDGGVDVDPVNGTVYYTDADGDGRGDPNTAQNLCAQPPGTVTNAGDCNDADALAWAGRRERCDGSDNDCNGLADEDDPGVDPTTGETWYTDGDGDGRGDPTTGAFSCTPVPGAVTNGGDCDDDEPLAWTGNPEVCDGVDNDCANGADDADPNLDRQTANRYFADLDGDGYGDPTTPVRRCVQPPGTVTNDGDCDDDEPLAWTGAVETCDDADNDCDGRLDEADPDLDPAELVNVWRDADGDGYGDPARAFQRCDVDPGTAANAGDCNDGDARAWTGAPEVCDGADNDCNGLVDGRDPGLDPSTAQTWYVDADGDTYGNPTTGQAACTPIPGRVSNGDDCNDAQPLAWTGAPEVCDGVDNNCVDGVDDADPAVDQTTQEAYYRDNDGDGYGVAPALYACEPPANSADNTDDCNDAQPLAWTGNTEVCDGGVDNDCNGFADDADAGLDRTTALVWYPDADRDGHGAKVGQFRRCVRPPGGAPLRDDCNDNEPLAWDNAPEVCDGVDNDCVNGIDEADPNIDLSTAQTAYDDLDGDGRGDPLTADIVCTLGPNQTTVGGDCHDGDDTVYPGAPEICDGQDNDCDPLVDAADPNAVGLVDVYTDGDGDTWGAGAATRGCPAPGQAIRGGDCDDGRADVNPGATEVCNGRDDDCDATVDSDTWWNAAWPYRVMVQVAAPATDTPAAPVSVDVDFGALLADLGDPTALSANSVRVVHQSCATGLVDVPSEFVDGLSGLFEARDVIDPVGDAAGAVVFLHDTDGDGATREVLAAGQTATYAIYFGSVGNGGAAPAPSYPSELVASVGGGLAELSNGLVTSTFSEAIGGLASAVGPQGGDGRLGAQSSRFGNGLLLSGPGGASPEWVTMRDGDATLSLVHAGPRVAVVRAEGEVAGTWGGYTYAWTWLLLDGRPELYGRVQIVLDAATQLGPLGATWSEAVRPWTVDNLALVVGVSEGQRDATTFQWARGAYDTAVAPNGAALGFRAPPLHAGRPVWSTNGRYIGVDGQDVDAAPAGNTRSLAAGTVVLDNAVMAMLPHDGPWADVADEFFGVIDGAAPAVGAAEAR